MIEVKGLTKVYKDIDQETRALNNVSFTLPDKGLVFVVGKSGSGKSTLINMIGGLDDITEGQVIIDGFDLSKAMVHELDKFRNNYLGIIYQNYNLFNDETVYENVYEAIDVISEDIDEKDVTKIIEAVELSEKTNTLVKNLSGGQKQRVAIARALIKKPKLILADEPTGNLDSKTAKKIFEFLKNASKECLVVVITHDMPSANDYADRIIEIADGSIISDVYRNQTKETNLKHIKLAENQKLTDKEISDLNKDLEKIEYHASRKEDRFSKTTKESVSTKNTYVPEKQKYRRLIRKSIKTFLRNKVSTIITTVVCVVMISLMSVAAAFVAFDSERAVNDVLDNYDINNLVIRKSYSQTGQTTKLMRHNYFEITKGEEDYIEQKGYTGKKFPVYNVDASYDARVFSVHGSGDIDFTQFYAKAPYGIVVCDEEYLHKTFGDFKVLAGSLYNCQDSAFAIIPDYIADAILYYQNLSSPDPNDPYQKLIMQPVVDRTGIGAVISTNYKEKFKPILSLVERMQKEPQHAKKLAVELANSDLYTHFITEATSYLNYYYSTNPNYHDEVYRCYSHNYLETVAVSETLNGPQKTWHRATPVAYEDNSVQDYNVALDYREYNKFFNANLTSPGDTNFVEKDFYITKYSNAEFESTVVKKSIKVHVTYVYEDLYYSSMRTSHVLHKEMMDWDIYQYAWVFDDPSQCYDLYKKTNPLFFYNPVDCFKVVYDTVNVIILFGDIFNIILASLLVILSLIILMHNFRIIKNETYRFGVLKSMGYQSRYLAAILFIIDILSILMIFSVSAFTGWGATLIANRLIQLGFAKYAHSQAYLSITMVSYNFLHVLIFSSILLGLLLVTSFIPFLVIRRIKPSKIIRASE